MNPIPTITKGDVLDPKRFENVVNRLVAAQFFRDAGPARIFLLNVRKYVEATLRGSPDDYDVMSEHMKFLLRESWDEINLAYDPENGRVHPAFASRIEAQGLPLSLYEEAMARVRDGRHATFESSLEAVCDEFHTPLPHVARAVMELIETEPELLKEEEAARTRLKEAHGKIASLRAGVISLLSHRAQLADRLEKLRADMAEIEVKRRLLSTRRDRARVDVARHLKKGAVIPWALLTERAAAAGGFEIALAELGRLAIEKQAEITAAEKELADYIADQADAFAPVARA